MGTLSIVKTTKGMRFGGYTEQLWNTNGGRQTYRKDCKNICFCFSLDLFKIYNFNNDYNSSIICDTTQVPWFYENKTNATFFYINNNNGLLFGGTSYKTKYNFFGKFDEDYEINNGQPQFSVAELEVFQILFDN